MNNSNIVDQIIEQVIEFETTFGCMPRGLAMTDSVRLELIKQLNQHYSRVDYSRVAIPNYRAFSKHSDTAYRFLGMELVKLEMQNINNDAWSLLP